MMHDLGSSAGLGLLAETNKLSVESWECLILRTVALQGHGLFSILDFEENYKSVWWWGSYCIMALRYTTVLQGASIM
jgi:hypothetical protein